MNASERRKVNTMDAVGVWGIKFSARLPVKGQQKLTRIGQNVVLIGTLDARQIGGANTAHGGVVQSGAAFEALRRLITRIHDTADSIDHDDELPDIAADFPLPAGRNLQTWLTAATDYATKAAPHTEDFVAYGMEEDFLTKLPALTQQARDAEDRQDSGDQASAGAVTSLDQLVRANLREVRSLRAIVNNTFGPDAETPDPDAVREWEVASHVEAAPHHAKEEETQAAPAA